MKIVPRSTHVINPAFGKTKVLLVDNHQLFRQGVRALVENHPKIQIIGEARNGREAVKMAKDQRPDVILMDVGMPVMDGIEATQRIIQETPGPRVLGLSRHSDKTRVLETIKAGALGYLTKDCESSELFSAITAVAEGRKFIGSGIMDTLITMVRDNFSKPAPFLGLTERELQILKLIAKGYRLKEIGHQLNVSTKTAETHRANLMRKLKIFNIPGLVIFALRENLISIEDF
jgi:DNA-binding NarL/FixJ family response regulator